MSILSRIKAVLTLDNKQFSQGLKKSQQQVNTFGKQGTKSIGTLTRSLGRAGLAGAISAVVAQLAAMSTELVKIRKDVQNAERAFQRFGTESYFQSLQESTSNSVDRLKLMHQAIQAVNLNLRTKDLPNFFKFATIRAAETGVAVDYLVNSIVTGVGRESRLVLDNLGISLKALNREMARVGGDFQEAAFNLIMKEANRAGVEIADVVSETEKLSKAWKEMYQSIANSMLGALMTELVGLLREFIEYATPERELDRFGHIKTAWEAQQELNKLQEEYNKLLKENADLVDEITLPDGTIVTMPTLFGVADPDLDRVKELTSLINELTDVFERLKAIERPELPPINPMVRGLSPTIPPGYNAADYSLQRAPLLGSFSRVEGVQEVYESMKEMPGVIAPGREALEEMAQAWHENTMAMKEFAEVAEVIKKPLIFLGEVIGEVLGMAVQSFTQALLDAIETGDLIGAFSRFLSDLGRMMASYGAALVAFGLAEEALTWGDAYTKIAAGVALIAAGAALTGISKSIRSGASSGSFSGGSYSGSYAGGNYGIANSLDLNREVVMVARGEDLVAVINRQNFRDGTNL